MDEQDLRERLFTAATAEPPPPVAVADDLARGHRVRHRRGAEGFGALSIVAVLATVAAVVGMPAHSAAPRTVVPVDPAGGGNATPSVPNHVTSPAVHLSPKGHGKRTSTGKSREHVTIGRAAEMPATPYALWRNELFELARQHLDPQGSFLSYETDSLQTARSEGGRALGIKMGWQSADDTGEGMVSAEVASAGFSDPVVCDDFSPCRSVFEPGYGQILLGGDPNGPNGFEVILTQADGETAHLVVTPLFGNNSLTPTRAALPSLDRVLAFAADSHFNLPAG